MRKPRRPCAPAATPAGPGPALGLCSPLASGLSYASVPSSPHIQPFGQPLLFWFPHLGAKENFDKFSFYENYVFNHLCTVLSDMLLFYFTFLCWGSVLFACLLVSLVSFSFGSLCDCLSQVCLPLPKLSSMGRACPTVDTAPVPSTHSAHTGPKPLTSTEERQASAQ